MPKQDIQRLLQIADGQAERVEIQRLIQEQLYSVASVITSKRDAAKTGAFGEMSGLTNLDAFVSAIAGHMATEAART